MEESRSKLSTMQLGYEDAKALNPRIVYASITGYGQTGPYASMAGYDVIIAADAGLFHMLVLSLLIFPPSFLLRR